ncbi:hypothetical protein GCM10011322_20830 [Salinarimonas ramus]|uniref:Uncharacterized protein n=1 Tax=Salinarimonas ramus TaxID=690164 RepID=A0A917Q843_9HYPH|nr:hypothetical protein GCM10011322_20830 [Salinarimonas ramus]
MAGARRSRSASRRGAGTPPASASSTARVAGPLTRTTQIAARPQPEAGAKIVSVCDEDGSGEADPVKTGSRRGDADRPIMRFRRARSARRRTTLGTAKGRVSLDDAALLSDTW